MEGPIRSVVMRGAIAMTDALANYKGIMKRIGCTHEVINKDRDGFSRKHKKGGCTINVNKCECMWKHFRHRMEQRHTFDSTTRYRLIAEFVYIFTENSWLDLIKF